MEERVGQKNGIVGKGKGGVGRIELDSDMPHFYPCHSTHPIRPSKSLLASTNGSPTIRLNSAPTPQNADQHLLKPI